MMQSMQQKKNNKVKSGTVEEDADAN